MALTTTTGAKSKLRHITGTAQEVLDAVEVIHGDLVTFGGAGSAWFAVYSIKP